MIAAEAWPSIRCTAVLAVLSSSVVGLVGLVVIAAVAALLVVLRRRLGVLTVLAHWRF